MISVALLAAAASFNLVCTGESAESKDVFSPPENVRPVTRIYRLNLESERYCVDECLSTSPIAKVTDTIITFKIERPEAKGDWNDYIEFANRETAEWIVRERVSFGGFVSVQMTTGQCKSAPFTGFPVQKF